MEKAVQMWVKTLREKLGFTQEQLAHEIEVTVSTVNRWENGHSAPSRLAVNAMKRLEEAKEAC